MKLNYFNLKKFKVYNKILDKILNFRFYKFLLNLNLIIIET